METAIIGTAVGLAIAWLLLIALLWVVRPRSTGLGQLLRVVPDVLRLARDLIADGDVPLAPRVALVALFLWLVSPIDLIPEFIPVLGPLDDVVVAVLVLRYVHHRLGDAQLRRRWRGTPEGFELLRGALGRGADA